MAALLMFNLLRKVIMMMVFSIYCFNWQSEVKTLIMVVFLKFMNTFYKNKIKS